MKVDTCLECQYRIKLKVHPSADFRKEETETQAEAAKLPKATTGWWQSWDKTLGLLTAAQGVSCPQGLSLGLDLEASCPSHGCATHTIVLCCFLGIQEPSWGDRLCIHEATKTQI